MSDLTTEQATKHTPGPWRRGSDGKRYVIWGASDGLTIATTPPCTNQGLEAAIYANSCLIGAAPDMYYALKLVRRLLAKDDSCEEIRAIDAALAKAEGLPHE